MAPAERSRRAGCRARESSVTECCVGFVFLLPPEGSECGTRVKMEVADVVPTVHPDELPDRLEERNDLDVADCAAHLGR